jgi:hypothetical protein
MVLDAWRDRPRIAIGSRSRRELRELEERLIVLKRHRDRSDV